MRMHRPMDAVVTLTRYARSVKSPELLPPRHHGRGATRALCIVSWTRCYTHVMHRYMDVVATKTFRHDTHVLPRHTRSVTSPELLPPRRYGRGATRTFLFRRTRSVVTHTFRHDAHVFTPYRPPDGTPCHTAFRVFLCNTTHA